VSGAKLSAVAFAFALSACAGRDPHPVAVVQPQDAQSDCAMIRAEIEAWMAGTEMDALKSRQQYLAALAE
jgi:hypothetical protein